MPPFIHSTVNGFGGRFQFLPITNQTEGNILAHVFWWPQAFSFIRCMPGDGIAA